MRVQSAAADSVVEYEKTMANPYTPPTTGVPEDKSAVGIKTWKSRQLFTALASLITLIVLAIVSFVLITQALRLNSESAAIPARLRGDYATTARSSWIGGIAAIAGALLNAYGLMLARKNKLIVPMLIIAITVTGMIAISIVFKPT